MELIKIIDDARPIQEFMSDIYTEEESKEVFSNIKACLSEETYEALKQTSKSYFNEANFPDLFRLKAKAKNGDSPIQTIIEFLFPWIKNKYRLTVNKVYAQSKDLNDLYSKVSYLLANDKALRSKYANHTMNVTTESLVMTDKTTGTVYQIMTDELYYSLTSINEIIENNLKSLSDKIDAATKEDLTKVREKADNVVAATMDSFKQNHGYVTTCDPKIKATLYNNITIESCITYYKDGISNVYAVIYNYNNLISDQLTLIKFIDLMYKRHITLYGNNPDTKYFVDQVYACCLKNMTDAMEFNSKVMTLLNEMIHFYADSLGDIYKLLKSK